MSGFDGMICVGCGELDPVRVDCACRRQIFRRMHRLSYYRSRRNERNRIRRGRFPAGLRHREACVVEFCTARSCGYAPFPQVCKFCDETVCRLSKYSACPICTDLMRGSLYAPKTSVTGATQAPYAARTVAPRHNPASYGAGFRAGERAGYESGKKAGERLGLARAKKALDFLRVK